MANPKSISVRIPIETMAELREISAEMIKDRQWRASLGPSPRMSRILAIVINRGIDSLREYIVFRPPVGLSAERTRSEVEERLMRAGVEALRARTEAATATKEPE